MNFQDFLFFQITQILFEKNESNKSIHSTNKQHMKSIQNIHRHIYQTKQWIFKLKFAFQTNENKNWKLLDQLEVIDKRIEWENKWIIWMIERVVKTKKRKNESCWNNWNFETERNKPIINKYIIIKDRFGSQTNHSKLKHSIQKND